MGCGSIRSQRRKSELFSLRDKIAISLVRTQSNITINSNTPGNITVKSDRCYKMKIIPCTLKFARSDLNVNYLGLKNSEFSDDYNFIKSTTNLFTIHKTYFFTSSHDACIHDVNIKDCIIVLLISIYSNQAVEVSFIKTYPYLFIKGDMNNVSVELLTAWRDYISAIETISKTNLAKLEKSKLNLENLLISISPQKHIKFPSEIKKIQQAISSCTSVIEEAKETKQEIINFIKSLETWQVSQIKKLGYKARMIQAYRGDQIVHQILT